LATSNHVTGRMGPEQSRAIDRQMRVEREMSRKTIRLIILGIGHAGKSTVMKQLKLLFGVAPTLQERKFMTDIIVRQVVRDLQLLIRKTEEFSMQETPFADEALKDMIRDMDPFCRLTPEIWEALRYIWSEVSIQFTWQNRSTFHVNDSLSYFMNNIDRLSQASYIPSQMDLVHAKVSTLGIAQQTFTFNHTDFKITDVGGQRSERRKWVHLFSDVTAIMYVAALNDFDRFLEEDARQNALAESMAVFHEMYDSPHLHNVTFFLFLNKIDLFMEKLPRVPVNSVDCFRDFKGPPGDVRAALRYFMFRFMGSPGRREAGPATDSPGASGGGGGEHPCPRRMYSHVTCAIDSSAIQEVFVECQRMILLKQMQGGGFLHAV